MSLELLESTLLPLRPLNQAFTLYTPEVDGFHVEVAVNVPVAPEEILIPVNAEVVAVPPFTLRFKVALVIVAAPLFIKSALTEKGEAVNAK